MAFRVELRPRAEQDLETLFRQLVQVAPIHGPDWVNGMERAIRLATRDAWTLSGCPPVLEGCRGSTPVALRQISAQLQGLLHS